MNSKRTYFLMLTVVGLLTIAIFGGAYEAKAVLAKKSTQLVGLKANLQGYQMQETGLTQAKKQIVTYTDLYHIAKAVVPENKNQAEKREDYHVPRDHISEETDRQGEGFRD